MVINRECFEILETLLFDDLGIVPEISNMSSCLHFTVSNSISYRSHVARHESHTTLHCVKFDK